MQWKRTHNCGELQSKDVGTKAVIMGWVARRRDHGSIIFIDLRDRWGITQVQFSPSTAGDFYDMAKGLRGEYVIAVKGNVENRPEGMINKKMATGEIEVVATSLDILSEAKTPPFSIVDDVDASEELRLKYRYLDLRRPEMQKNLLIRHRTYQVVRKFFDENGFMEIETPILMKSTPEGARDYLVPSRVFKGSFYALPQSPQTYKQLLMVSGFDRYFQIVRCFRDEDLRADRQPEFTQIDVEMSFVSEEDIFNTMEPLMQMVLKKVLGVHIEIPFPRITYDDALSLYGSDKPDLRFDMKIQNVSDIVANSEFRVFADTIKSEGVICGICAKGCAGYSRKQIDGLAAWIKDKGGKGLVAIKIKDIDWDSGLAKFFKESQRKAVIKKFTAQNGDLVLLVADDRITGLSLLGDLRLKIAADENLINPNQYKLAWITEFPLFEYNKDEKRYQAMHHPFTSPVPEHLPLIESEPGKVKARAYDLVMNGAEIAGGSIRIHQRNIQEAMFRALGIDDEEARSKFGFLMNAFEYGVPPHGGIAFGFDRLIMLLAGCSSLREVIAFPKTTSAQSLMDGSPTEISMNQLEELGLSLLKKSSQER